MASLTPDPTMALELLSVETLCTSHLVEMTGAKQTNISNHMKALRVSGLVTAQPRGRFTFYVLASGALRRLARQLTALADAATGTQPRRAC